ncbi:MAG: GNAT family N-acetyltransferase [Marmoricola sp.]
MHLKEYVADDTEAVETGRAIINATRVFETPWLPEVTAHRREMHVRHGWDGPPDRHFLAWVDGVAVGVAHVETGEWDNQDLAWLALVVHPECRGRGHGSELLERLMHVGRGEGCTKVGASGWDLPGVEAFAKRHGFERGSQEVYRVQHPRELPAGLASAAYDEAVLLATDYELVRITGETPEELLPAVVDLADAINDAPLDDLDIEHEVFTAERVQSYERATIGSGHRLHRVIARHRQTGRLAGHTVVAVDTESPRLAHQHDTSVLRDHRGHRLGLLLKADMMRWLAEQEPQIEALDTWNAETNDHMIVVNERLGYRVEGRELAFQRRL